MKIRAIILTFWAETYHLKEIKYNLGNCCSRLLQDSSAEYFLAIKAYSKSWLRIGDLLEFVHMKIGGYSLVEILRSELVEAKYSLKIQIELWPQNPKLLAVS